MRDYLDETYETEFKDYILLLKIITITILAMVLLAFIYLKHIEVILSGIIVWVLFALTLLFTFRKSTVYMVRKFIQNTSKRFKEKMPTRKYKLKPNVMIKSTDSLEQINIAVKKIEYLEALIKVLKCNEDAAIRIHNHETTKHDYKFDIDSETGDIFVEALENYLSEIKASLGRYIKL